MSRTLTAGIAGAILDTKLQRAIHLLTFTIGAGTYRFAEDEVRYAGQLYTARLVMKDSIRHTQRPQLEPVTVKLQNIDKATADILQTEGVDVQGVEATISRLYLPVNEALILVIAEITAIEVNEREATLTLSGDLDPTASMVPKRKYSPLDSTDGKTFAEWAATPHLFDGFLHISRDLTMAVEGQGETPEESRVLGDYVE